MFDLVFFTKSALTDGAGWKSSSGVILGVRNGRMTWSIPLSSFSALVTGETSFYCYPFFTYLGGSCTGNTGWESSVCWLVQCNCDMLGYLFLVHAIYSR